MKKVLILFDGEHFSAGAIEFVSQMNRGCKVMAVGVFLPAIDYAGLLYSFGGVLAGPLYISEAVPGNEQIIAANKTRFTELCRTNGVACSVHNDDDVHVVNAIRQETKFADLIVLNSSTFYNNAGKYAQKDYVANVLHKAECPVMLVNYDYETPQTIILSYDGSEQSVFAIKQFSYLLPVYNVLDVLLVYFAPKGREIPYRKQIQELLNCYYGQVTITHLNITDADKIEQWIAGNPHPVLVTGAHGRNILSELFLESFAAASVQDHKYPIFIAHK